MKTLLISLSIVLTILNGYAQKPPISDTTYKEWTEVGAGILSPNGKYASYTVTPVGGTKGMMYITSTDRTWTSSWSTLERPVFSRNGKYVYVTIDGKLLRIRLSTDIVDTIASCSHYELIANGNNEFLIYVRQQDNKLIIASTSTKIVYEFSDVINYQKADARPTIVITLKSSDKKFEILKLLNLKTGELREIYKGQPTSHLVFSENGRSLAFVSEENGTKSIWLFQPSLESARKIICDSAIEKGYTIKCNDIYQFAARGSKLLFTLEKVNRSVPSPNAPEVWSYEDQMIYLRYKLNGFKAPNFDQPGKNLCQIDLTTGHYIKIADTAESVLPGILRLGSVIPIVTKKITAPDSAVKSIALYDLLTGSREVLKANLRFGVKGFSLSPDERYAIYFNSDEQQWISFDRNSKKEYHFAQAFADKLFPYSISRRGKLSDNLDVLGWVRGTDHVILQGTFDIWEFSVSGSAAPINITRNGQSSNIIYTACQIPDQGLFDRQKEIYLYSHNLYDKTNAIYQLNLLNRKLIELHKGNVYWSPLYLSVGPENFCKAEAADAFLFKDGSVGRSPNYYFTSNFKQITAISDNRPELKYNWITSALINYIDIEGRPCQGILYKPENFDISKRYPVLFSIYAEQSQTLNEHLTPEPVKAGLNIPYLVSNGYIVCKPDVYVRKGEIGESALQSTLAAARYLAQQPWIDSTKFGLTGHSFGGFLVDYIVSRSDRFAAAAAGAGPSNLVNNYSDLWDNLGDTRHGIMVEGSFWMGRHLNEYLEGYVANSPLFFAKNVNTPLLLYHNEKDANVQYYHSVQFFTELRRLGKKAWLLSYPGESHVISRLDNRVDFQYKLNSFFDYFLRGSHKPQWLSEHIEK